MDLSVWSVVTNNRDKCIFPVYLKNIRPTSFLFISSNKDYFLCTLY